MPLNSAQKWTGAEVNARNSVDANPEKHMRADASEKADALEEININTAIYYLTRSSHSLRYVRKYYNRITYNEL